ncbi:transcription factor S-II, central domain-containing protein [Cokeromyces recurvatus]|uniref:transcription factor S-II, central domain-containing protein n=1 Tax=Cokeromyces recurvatus TaxID=90255 RepID=UPI00221FA7F8|nr:transcription factor S-II, central domain-containing protein [Cokeromyces recurvatus]KAI7899336.1 transcription factor S-II, central domain-containing protein [Cokeromyces recurvatus]
MRTSVASISIDKKPVSSTTNNNKDNSDDVNNDVINQPEEKTEMITDEEGSTPNTPMSPSLMTEEENPVRRNVIKNMTNVLRSIFDESLKENADMFEGNPDPQERAEELARSIEKTMLEQLGEFNKGRQRTCGEKYKSKFRSLLYNLKDKANKVFQLRVVTGDLSPHDLVKMSSEDMANPELKSMSEVLRKKALKNSVMTIDNMPIIKKTHKGDIIMVPKSNQDEDMYSQQVKQELERISSADTHHPSSPSTKEPNKKNHISSLSPNNTSSDSKIMDPLDNILARIGIPTYLDDNKGNKRESTTEDVDPELKRRKVTKDVEELLGEEDDTPFMVEEVDTTKLDNNDQEENEEKEEIQEEEKEIMEEEEGEGEKGLPTIWHGRVNMPQVAEFEATARQIGGRLLSEKEWQDVLSPTMWIEGRIPTDRVTNYITQTQYSTSREIVLIEVEAKSDHKEQEQTLIKYLESRQRYAVIGHNKKIVKDFYLIPLYQTQQIPDCLYVVRVEERKRKSDLFLGVLVITKQQQQQQQQQQTYHTISQSNLPPPPQQAVTNPPPQLQYPTASVQQNMYYPSPQYYYPQGQYYPPQQQHSNNNNNNNNNYSSSYYRPPY